MPTATSTKLQQRRDGKALQKVLAVCSSQPVSCGCLGFSRESFGRRHDVSAGARRGGCIRVYFFIVALWLMCLLLDDATPAKTPACPVPVLDQTFSKACIPSILTMPLQLSQHVVWSGPDYGMCLILPHVLKAVLCNSSEACNNL